MVEVGFLHSFNLSKISIPHRVGILTNVIVSGMFPKIMGSVSWIFGKIAPRLAGSRL
jgi:hypothetical protein